MNRPKRAIKPTLKVIENKQTEKPKSIKEKKAQKKQKLQKRIEQQKQIIEKKIEKEIQDDDYVEVVRDSSSKIYKDLMYKRTDLTDKIKKLIDAFPIDFLPDLFKGLVPLYIEKEPISIKQKVFLTKLKNGDYHTVRSKSDGNKASTIKSVIKNFPFFKDFKEDDLSFFIKNHLHYLYDALHHIFSKKLAISTFKGYIDTLLRIMNISFANPKKNPVYIKYATLSKSLGFQQEKIDDDNTLNENESTRYIEWDVVLKKQKELYDTFNKIQNKNTKEAYDVNLDLILLSLYTLIPVLRREPLTLEFNENTGDKSKDYVIFKRNDVILDLNLDKKRHDPIQFTLEGELASILKQSYKLYPRTYLFTDYRKYPNYDKKLTEAAVANRLRKIFIKYGVNVGASILRASYATNYFNLNPNFIMKDLKEISVKMRTSTKYLLTSYKKVLSQPAIIVNEPNVKVKVEVKEEVIDNIDRTHIQKVVEDPYIKGNEMLKKKYHSDNEYRLKVLAQQQEYKKKVGAFEIQKRKIISMLRNSPEYRKRVTKKTLERYNINLNDI